MDLPLDRVPDPDPRARGAGYVVTVGFGDRIHFVDWRASESGGPSGTERPGQNGDPGGPGPVGVLLIHGLASTNDVWTPVARRLVGVLPVVAMDLRGHGLSDAPTDAGAYEVHALADDVVAVAEGSGLLTGGSGLLTRSSGLLPEGSGLLPEGAAAPGIPRVVLAGHGFGAIVAAQAAAALGPRCAGLVLVDGGWVGLEAVTGLDVDGFLRGLDEPPGVLASMSAFLADRESFDPASWDADQEVAARATVVETPAGRVVRVTRPHVLEACVRSMFDHDPVQVLPAVEAPILGLAAEPSGDDAPGEAEAALARVDQRRVERGLAPIRVIPFPRFGHNLMRYRPDAVSAAILAVADQPVTA